MRRNEEDTKTFHVRLFSKKNRVVGSPVDEKMEVPDSSSKIVRRFLIDRKIASILGTNSSSNKTNSFIWM